MVSIYISPLLFYYYYYYYFKKKESDQDSDDCEYEMTEQRTNERRIEQQLDEFRIKWKKEIQQRTVYGHVIDDKQKDQKQEETIDNEEQVEKY